MLNALNVNVHANANAVKVADRLTCDEGFAQRSFLVTASMYVSQFQNTGDVLVKLKHLSNFEQIANQCVFHPEKYSIFEDGRDTPRRHQGFFSPIGKPLANVGEIDHMTVKNMGKRLKKLKNRRRRQDDGEKKGEGNSNLPGSDSNQFSRATVAPKERRKLATNRYQVSDEVSREPPPELLEAIGGDVSFADLFTPLGLDRIAMPVCAFPVQDIRDSNNLKRRSMQGQSALAIDPLELDGSLNTHFPPIHRAKPPERKNSRLVSQWSKAKAASVATGMVREGSSPQINMASKYGNDNDRPLTPAPEEAEVEAARILLAEQRLKSLSPDIIRKTSKKNASQLVSLHRASFEAAKRQKERELRDQLQSIQEHRSQAFSSKYYMQKAFEAARKEAVEVSWKSFLVTRDEEELLQTRKKHEEKILFLKERRSPPPQRVAISHSLENAHPEHDSRSVSVADAPSRGGLSAADFSMLSAAQRKHRTSPGGSPTRKNSPPKRIIPKVSDYENCWSIADRYYEADRTTLPMRKKLYANVAKVLEGSAGATEEIHVVFGEYVRRMLHRGLPANDIMVQKLLDKLDIDTVNDERIAAALKIIYEEAHINEADVNFWKSVRNLLGDGDDKKRRRNRGGLDKGSGRRIAGGGAGLDAQQQPTSHRSSQRGDDADNDPEAEQQ